MFAILALLMSSCGKLPPSALSSSESPNPRDQPTGAPLLFGWEGVNGRILMTDLWHDPGMSAKLNLDTATWVFAGTGWIRASSAQAIPPHGAAVLVYDRARHREVLAAGKSKYPTDPNNSGTWEWDGRAWNRVITTYELPFLSQNVSAAYSPELHAVVMLDTCSGTMQKTQGQTLLFDGIDWRSIEPVHWPQCPATLAYSPSRHSILALSLRNFETWKFDGRDWIAVPGDGGVTPFMRSGMGRQAPAADLDRKRDTWVVFGGSDGGPSVDDTWTGDGASWVKRSPALSPSGRLGIPGRPFMVWDPNRGDLVLFGGSSAPYGLALGDTWSWNGRVWAHLAGPVLPTPSPPTPSASASR